MIKNSKGITLFELLITISLASVVLMTLMSVLTTTLITRNELDYTNRLSQENFELINTLNRTFGNLGYSSIVNLSPEDNTNHYVFVLTNEYDFDDTVPGGIIYYNDSYILHLNLLTGGLYLGPYINFDQTLLTFDDPTQYRITSSRFSIVEGSSMSFECIRLFSTALEDNLYGTCAHAFIELDFTVSYEFRGENLKPRDYYTTLFF